MAAWDITTSSARLEFDTSYAGNMSAAKIDANHFIAFWRGTSSFDGYTQVFAVDTSTWAVTTSGAKLEFDLADLTDCDVEKIDDNHFITVWKSTSNAWKAQVFAVNTSTWAVTTSGAVVTFSPTGTSSSYGTRFSLSKIDGTHYGVFNFDTSSDGYAQVLVVNTSTWAVTTVGTPLEYDTRSALNTSAILIDTNHFVNTWLGDSDDAYTQAFVVNTSTWNITTANSSLEFDTIGSTYASSGKSIQSILLDDNHYLVTWGGESNYGYAQVFAVNTSTWAITTSGAKFTITTSYPGSADTILIDSNHFIMGWRELDGRVQTFSINTSTWEITTASSQLIYLTSTSAYNLESVLIDSNHFISFYSQSNDSDGYVQVFSVELPAEAMEVVINKGLAYKVVKEYSTTKALAYRVKTDTTIQKGLTYEVDEGVSGTTVTKDLDYTVKTDTTITKGLSYVVTGWYDTNWIYRVKITVDADQVDANLTDFPIYVDLSDLPAGFHTNVKSDGGDIRVTEDDGTTEVPREVVFYNSTTDTGELHFKGDVSSTVDTDFYIYYGNSSASDYAIDNTYGAENVWNSNYKAVYHLQEAVNTDTGGYLDSTSSDADGTGISMSLTAPDGTIGKAQDFDGSADYINMGDVLDLGTNDMTISAWTYADANSSMFVSKALAAAQDYRYATGIAATTGKYWMFFKGNGGTDISLEGNSNVVGGWHMAHFVFDRDANGTIYTDGANATSGAISSFSGQNFQSTNPFRIGAYTAADNTSIYLPYNGKLDEVRIVFTALSSTWISTEYNNQSSPSTFFVIGSQEEISTTSSISITKDLAYKIKQSISITKSIAYRIKTDSSITKNLEYSIVDENTITKGLVYEVIVTTTETIQKDLDYSIVTDTAIQKGLEYQVITDVQIQRDVDYFIKTETALQKELDYAVRTSDSVAKDLEYIIIITDSINKDLDYTVLTEGLIQKSMLYEVVVTGVEKVQATLDYTILTNINVQKDLDYSIVTEGTIQKDLSYAVQPSTAITKGSIYKVISQKDSTKDLDYHIVIPKLIQKDVTYFIKGSTGIQKDADYSVITTIDQDKALDYRVITEGDIQKDVDYYISITTNVEKDINYNLQVSTTIQKGVTYSIDVPSIIVQKDLDYAIVTTTSTTTDLDYNILLESTIQKDADYSVMGSTAITKGIEYTVIAPQSIEQALQYTIAITPSALEKALEYIIVQRTTKQYELRYRVDAPHSISKDLMYTIGEKIGIWIKHPGERSDSFTKDEGVSSTYTKTESVTASSYTKEESVTPSTYTKTEKESSLWTKI